MIQLFREIADEFKQSFQDICLEPGIKLKFGEIGSNFTVE